MRSRRCGLIFGIIVLCSSSYGLEDSPIVSLPGLGILRGRTIQTAWTHRDVHQFVDVKYGESPTGENRFKVHMWNLPRVLPLERVKSERCKVILAKLTIFDISFPNIIKKYNIITATTSCELLGWNPRCHEKWSGMPFNFIIG